MCMLCGTEWSLELKNLDVIKLQISKRYLEGPFAYQHVMSRNEPTAYFCSHCLNHIRKRKYKSKFQMLPMDLYLLGLLHYIYIIKMDKRSLKRIKKTLQEKNNIFKNIAIHPIQILLDCSNIQETWFSINLSNIFFSHSAIAKFMRKSQKLNLQ
jgi:hypothetical protein